MFKRYMTAIIAAALLFSMSACDNLREDDNTEKLSVFYVNTKSYESGGEYIESVDYFIAENDDAIHNALDYLASPPADSGLISSLVKGTRIYSYSLNNGEIAVTLSPAYLLLNEMEKAIAKCCITLTMCNIDEVDSVSIYVDEKLVEEKLDARMMIIEDTDTNEFDKQISLYFPEENYYYLCAESRVLTVGQDKLLAEYVIEELIKSTLSEGLKPSVPDGTKLLSVVLKNGVCTVNLSSEFVANRPVSAAEQRMTVYSIVNSIVNLENIDEVRFQIEGNEAYGYEYVDLTDSFTAFESIIYDPREASKLFATVYLGNAESGKMIKTPVVIDRVSEMTIEENIVRYVLGMSKVGGYESVIPKAVSLRSIANVNGECTVDLSAGLFAGGSSKIATFASCAIAASIIDSGVANQVTITVEGKRYLENITQYSDIIIE